MARAERSTEPSVMNLPEPKPRICCLDLDTFFVSVERLMNPDLIGKPVVVGAMPGNRGVVSAASYEVREFGVRSGMPISEAYRLAPHATFVSGHNNEYRKHAAAVKTILERFAPIVRTASIDEFFLDFSGCEQFYRQVEDADDDATIERVVREMRQAIQDELGLPASAGIATTKPIAKIASGSAKPAGSIMIRAGEELAFIRDLPVRRWPGIGPVAEKRLHAKQIRTLGELLESSEATAVGVRRGLLGSETDSLGRDRPAFREHDADGLTLGSISNECTFSADVGDRQKIIDQLRILSERVCWRLRQRGILARTITLKLRYANFETLTRARTIKPTDAEQVVGRRVRELWEANCDPSRRIRLLGVALSNLVRPEQQLMLPFDAEERGEVAEAIDEVRERFGYDAIHFGKQSKSRWVR